MAVIDWWNGPLTLVVIFFALCLLLLTWSIACVACCACHSSGTPLFSLWHTHTHTHTHQAYLTHNIGSASALPISFEFTLSVAKSVALFETVCILRTVKWRVTGDRNSKSNERISGCTVLLLVKKIEKKWIKLIPKTIGNRKRDCAWGCDRGINTTWENLQIENLAAQIRKAFVSLTELICAFRSADFLRWCLSPSATSRTISFSFSNSFWY